MANNSDARRVVVLNPGDAGYEFARKFYLATPGTVDARRLEQGTAGQTGFERAWRIAIVAQGVNARAGYYVDATGVPIASGGNLTYAQMPTYAAHTYST